MTSPIPHVKPTARPQSFRPRSMEITRIEGLSDAVFGFAVTLLIVSLEVPRTYSELSTAMRGFLPFAICFALLIELWFDTKESIGAALIYIAIGATSITVAWLEGPRWTAAAGMVYPIGFPVLLTIFYSVTGNRRRKLQAAD